MVIYFKENGKSLSHHGIQGQKWGIRRFQNEDGSLTPAGRERYGIGGKKIRATTDAKEIQNQVHELCSQKDLNFEGRFNPNDKHFATTARVGLRALNDLRYANTLDPDDPREQEWFAIEDQTIGLGFVTSMLVSGVSAENVKQLLKNVLSSDDVISKYGEGDLDPDTETVVFYADNINYSQFGSAYIDRCEQILKSGKY